MPKKDGGPGSTSPDPVEQYSRGPREGQGVAEERLAGENAAARIGASSSGDPNLPVDTKGKLRDDWADVKDEHKSES